MGSYYPPPLYQGDRLLELMQQRGQIGSQAAQQSGEIWGGALQSLGQQASHFVQQYGEAKKQDAVSKRAQAFQGLFADPNRLPTLPELVKNLGPTDGVAVFKGLETVKPDAAKQYKDRMSLLKDSAKGILGTPEEFRPHAYGVMRQGLTANGIIKPDELPEEYDLGLVKQAASYGEDAPKAPPGTVVETIGPDGQPVKRMVSAEEMAKGVPMVPPKPPAGHMVTVAGPNGQPIQRLASEEELKAGVAAYREPKAPKTGDADHERLIQAVVANPSLWNDLTPTEKGKLAPDLNAQGFTGFGKPMTDGAIKQISETKSAIDSLQDLRSTLKENEQYIGPIAGFQALNPYSDANKAQAKIDLVRQRVGKALEGGVLRKEDEEKYKKILATLRDTPENAISKVDNLIKTLERDTATFADQQRLAGRRTPQQGGAAPPQAPAAGPPRAGSVVRGYRFLGGNPADPKAWVRQ